MLNKNIFKSIFIIFILMVIVFGSSSSAQEQQNPEKFVEYIYANYADENFKEVYVNFADELKKMITEEEYVEFQKRNFEKYSLEYSNIKVADKKELNYEEFKDEFDFLNTEGDFYSFEVSYLLKFNRFGDREEETKKKVFLRSSNSKADNQNNKKYELFWDPEPILKDEDSESVD